VAAVKVNGIDFYNTIFHQNILTAKFSVSKMTGLIEEEA